LAIKVIECVQHAERASVTKTVVHKVQTPDLIGGRGLEELLFDTSWKPFLGPAVNIEPHGRVDPVDTLVIPRTTFIA